MQGRSGSWCTSRLDDGDGNGNGALMRRRTFLEASSAAVAGMALGACAPRAMPAPAPTPRRRLVNLVPADVSWDRVIRTTVGLRPHRDSGFVLKAERLDDKT